MKLTFNLAEPVQAHAGLSVSASEFLDCAGVVRKEEKRPAGAEEPVSPARFEAALKNLVAALLNADPSEAGVWAEVLVKEVGGSTALLAFERLRDNNAKTLAAWAWKEPIEWESPSAKVDPLLADHALNSPVPP